MEILLTYIPFALEIFHVLKYCKEDNNEKCLNHLLSIQEIADVYRWFYDIKEHKHFTEHRAGRVLRKMGFKTHTARHHYNQKYRNATCLLWNNTLYKHWRTVFS